MSTIVTRAGKGSALTYAEVDSNFTNLNTDKYQSGSTASLASLTLTSALAVTSGGTGVTTSTGSNSVVLSTSPTLVTPTLGAAVATSVEFGLGAAATPSITFTGDLNTGVFSPTADTVAISTAGVERLLVSSAGNVGIGTSSPSVPLNIGDSTLAIGVAVPQVLISTDVTAGHSISVRKCANTQGASPNISQVRSRGTAAAPVIVNSNDVIGNNTWWAYDGTQYRNLAVMSVRVDGTPGAANMPGALVFSTSPAGAVTPSERLRIDNQGNVGIGTAATLSKLSVAGPIALQSPSTVNAATYTVAITDSSLRFTTTDNTLTLPAAASFPGRILYLNTITANSVTSAASDVIPLGSDTPGTAIFAATAGKFAMLQSNGTSWITMMSN